jgi:hypothetical protein
MYAFSLNTDKGGQKITNALQQLKIYLKGIYALLYVYVVSS